MKKILSILLVAILIVTSLATVAFAAGSASVYGNSKTVSAGDKVTISFSLSEPATFAVYEMQISYDSTVLTLDSIDKGAASDGYFDSNVANGKVAFASSEDITVSGTLFSATFTVSENAQPGTYPVNLSIGYIADENLEYLTVSAAGGTVIIECSHVWDNGVQTKAPDCTEEGEIVYTCTKCGETKTEVVPALGHDWTTEWSTDETHHWHTCTRCGENCEHFGEHEFETIIDEYPTDEKDGKKHDECKICGYRLPDVVIPADPGVDPMPPTGDMTPTFVYALVSMLAVLAAAAFVTMRKFAK